MTNKKYRPLLYSLLIILILVIFFIFYQQRTQNTTKKPEPISGTAFKLNTVINIKIYDSADQSLIDEVFHLCDKYEALFSRTLESSELYKLNHGTLPKQDENYIVSAETADLIAKGLTYSRLSEGSFDISIEPVSSLWDFTSEKKAVPTQAELTHALSLVDYKDVTLTGNHIQFQKEGMSLDLGAIAKGYIADRMKDFLVSKGVSSAIINLGGNVLCIGEKPDGTPFQVGIQRPFADRSETIASIGISDKSVVSSGIYERFFEKDGQFYHHILNPATGYPYDNSLISVTIISEKSVDGDGLSTSCFALGLEKGMALINGIPDVHAVFITDDYKLHYSENFPK